MKMEYCENDKLGDIYNKIAPMIKMIYALGHPKYSTTSEEISEG